MASLYVHYRADDVFHVEHICDLQREGNLKPDPQYLKPNTSSLKPGT